MIEYLVALGTSCHPFLEREKSKAKGIIAEGLSECCRLERGND